MLEKAMKIKKRF